MRSSHSGLVHIRTVTSEDWCGYQVTVPCARQRAFNGHKRSSLREALEHRNALYYRLGVLPRRTLLETLPAKRRSAEPSNTGLRHISRRVNDGCDVFAVRVRNLFTAGPWTVRVLLHHHRSERAALREARALLRANLDAYNAIVKLYNERRREQVFRAAELEARRLQPRVTRLMGLDLALWRACRRAVFPRLVHAVDPRRGGGA